MNVFKSRVIFKITFEVLLFLITLYLGFSLIHKDTTVNAPVIFSMEELGFSDSKTIGAQYDKEEAYYLYLENENEDFLKIRLYDCGGSDFAKELLESTIISKREYQLKHSCIGDCYIGKITFEQASKDWFVLTDWDVDIGYIDFDYHNEPMDGIGWYDAVLVKGNKMLHLEIDCDIELSQENIDVLVSIFDREIR